MAGGKWERFLAGQRTEPTKTTYEGGLKAVLGQDPDWILGKSKKEKEVFIEDYILANKATVNAHTLVNRIKAVKSFLNYADANNINWSKLLKLIPRFNSSANDRAPTVEELQALLSVCSPRDRTIVFVLCSSGIRAGAIPDLKVKDYQRLDADGSQIGKLTVYSGTPDQYTTFISAEAVESLEAYLKMRRDSNEQITNNSPLFRTRFDLYKNSQVKPLDVDALKQLFTHLWRKCGKRTKDAKYQRKEFKTLHGFRKFFKTQLEGAGMKTLLVERLMGHVSGLEGSYYKPSDNEMLSEYIRFMPALYVSSEYRLKNAYELTKEELDRRISEIEEKVARERNNYSKQEWNRGISLSEHEKPVAKYPERTEIGRSDLSDYLKRGFKPILELSDGKIIVELSP